MNKLIFNSENLKILNKLVFDSSINISRLGELKLDNNILKFYIERRVFENVKRKNFFFWKKTYFEGMLSEINIESVKGFRIAPLNLIGEPLNDFVLEFHYNEKSKNLCLRTTKYDCAISIILLDKLKIMINDIGSSEFGKGVCLGKKGFTRNEWNIYLRKNNYALNH